MNGPYERGRCTSGGDLQVYRDLLRSGRRYRVCREFVDFDGHLHLRGEEWTFLGASFLPYDDGLSLFVSLDGVREWQIRMQCRPAAQGEIVNSLSSYLEPM